MNSTNNPVVAEPAITDFPPQFNDAAVEGVVTPPSGGATFRNQAEFGIDPQAPSELILSEIPLFVKQ